MITRPRWDLRPRRCFVCGGIIDNADAERKGDLVFGFALVDDGLYRHEEQRTCIRELRELMRTLIKDTHRDIRIPVGGDTGDIEAQIANMLLFLGEK